MIQLSLRRAYCTFVLVFFLAFTALSQTATETGKFRLHKFQQAIGEETYTITQTGETLTMKSDFKFTDRGSPVPLTTNLTTDVDLNPKSFTIKGSTARGSSIDDEITINGTSANIREEKETRKTAVPKNFFTIAGYAPASMQMLMMRYIAKNKIRGPLETLPGGTVTVEDRGKDRVTIDGKPVELERFIVNGLIWGRESLWMDKQQNLVALIGVDAEFDHFEALREGFEPALAFFVAKGAEDGMAALSEISNGLSPQSKGTLAIVNGILIDGTGKAPVTDSVVVLENGRIKAVGTKSSVQIPKGAKTFDAKG